MSNVYEELPYEVDESIGDLDAETLIRRALDAVTSAKAMPLSASALIQRDEVAGYLSIALERIPDEMRQARRLLREREVFLAERAREAEALMEEVRAHAERMVSRTEIIRQSNQMAQRILDAANEEARRLRHEAEDYCDQRLAAMEIVLDRTMRTVRAGRDKLAAVPAVSSEPADDEQASASAAGTVDPDGTGDSRFFDQDLA